MRALKGVQSSKEQVASLRKEVAGFIVRQIEAYPSISKSVLEAQLAAAFSVGMEDAAPPRVVAASDSAARRVFVVAYSWFRFHGRGGSETILES